MSTLNGLPEFDSTAISSSGETPEKHIVAAKMEELTAGVNSYLEMQQKLDNEDTATESTRDARDRTVVQIQQARQELAGLGVQLPLLNVNVETTTNEQRIHELAMWLSSYYDENSSEEFL